MPRKTLVQQLVEVVDQVDLGQPLAETRIAQAIVEAGWRPAKSPGPNPSDDLDREHVARSLELHSTKIRREATFYYDRLVADVIRGLADDVRHGRVVLNGEAAAEDFR